ncbi:Formamidopyrimidine-DNA glycosylase [subsurface metagenome]
MPELPEVETVKNELLPHIIGRQITGVALFWEKMVRQPSVGEFRSRLIGQRITGITRRGKYLSLGLTSHEVLIIHLKMSGSLLLKPAAAENDKYTRAILYLDGDMALHFRDPRKFGTMWLVADEDAIIGKLGPEPLEANFTPQLLAKLMSKRTAPVKALLHDQNVIAGIGNMYADEALHVARIHPLRPGGSLSRDEVERLNRAIKEVLSNGIKNMGASTETYYRPSGEKGFAHHHFKVAHRGGQPCPTCNTPIERIKVRNRGTYFCPKCQPAQR